MGPEVNLNAYRGATRQSDQLGGNSLKNLSLRQTASFNQQSISSFKQQLNNLSQVLNNSLTKTTIRYQYITVQATYCYKYTIPG